MGKGDKSMDIATINRSKVFIYMTIMMILIGVLGHFLSRTFGWGLTGTGLFIAVGGIMNCIAYFFSDKLILKATKARILKREQIPRLFEIVEKITRSQNMPMPKLYLVEAETMNAFATGRDPQHSAVAVTRGLVERLTEKELQAVVAHELAHIKNWDMLLMTFIAISVGFISILSDAYWRSSVMQTAQEKDKSGILGIISMILVVFAPLIAMFIQLAISRQREYIADSDGAAMTHDRLSLAAALEKISKDTRPVLGISRSTAHLCFSNPLQKDGLIDRLFSTHPPIQERIISLKGKQNKEGIYE